MKKYTNNWKFIEDTNMNGYSLVIPSVAVGNVAQLTCDLLISSLHMKKIASVYSTALIPVLGYDPYNLSSGNLSTSCDVYKSDARKVVVVQFRAPLIYKYARSFLESIIKKFKEFNVNNVIVLTSSFAHEKHHIMSSPFRYLANNLCIYKDKIKDLRWLEHEKPNSEVKIYGGGFATLLYTIICDNNLPCLVLFKYCSEGDNIPDSYDMVCYLSKIMILFEDGLSVPSQLIQPVSWKLLFGKPPPNEIY